MPDPPPQPGPEQQHQSPPTRLVDILAVVGLVAVFIGAGSIVFPNFGGGMPPGHEVRCSIKDLALAIKQYEATYGFLPFAAGEALQKRGLGVESPVTLDDTLYADLIKTLQGDPVLNPRELKWLEPQYVDGAPVPGRFEANGAGKVILT